MGGIEGGVLVKARCSFGATFLLWSLCSNHRLHFFFVYLYSHLAWSLTAAEKDIFQTITITPYIIIPITIIITITIIIVIIIFITIIITIIIIIT